MTSSQKQQQQHDTADHHGPELLLTPIRELLTTRESSRSRSSSPRNTHRNRVAAATAAAAVYGLLISDIVVVETCNVRYGAAAHRIQVTTLSAGYFEFDCLSRNGHDILLAFLQASLPEERILDGRLAAGSSTPGIRHTSSGLSCLGDTDDGDLDVDALTAAHLKGQAERETWMEKISRRTGKVVSSLSEITETFCESIVCCQARDAAGDDIRESPPRHHTGQLELDNDDAYSVSLNNREESFNKASAKLMLKNCHLPSGLSVEPNPEMISKFE
jgi:hypothetical protein